jgi:hypothetical protein
MRSIATTLALVLATSSALAADLNENFYMMGPGTVSCKQYAYATDEQKVIAQTWMVGYISAVNRMSADTWHIAGEAKLEAVYAMIAKHCMDNPETALGIATQNVLDQLRPNRTRKSPT